MTQQQRNTIILTLGALTALGPFSIDMYLPGFSAIAADLDTDIAQVGFSLTSYFIGISAGQLVYGPLTDRYGRKKPLTIGLIIYTAASIGCIFSPTVSWLIGLRLLQALGGCVGIVAGRAVVRDLFEAGEIAKVFSTLILVMGVAPIVAPTLGGYVTATFGWRAIFVILTLMAITLILVVNRFLPESKEPDESVSLKPKKVLKDYLRVVKEPVFITYTIAGSISFAGLFTYISGSPFVFMEYFGLSETQYGWIFGLNAFGFILGSQLNRLWLKRAKPAQIAFSTGVLEFLSGLLLLMGSLLGILDITGTLILLFSFMLWMGFLVPNATAVALEPFKRYAGSASALLGSLQMIAGAIASGLVSYLHDGSALPMTALMASCSVVVLGALLIHRQKEKKGRLRPSTQQM